MELCFSRIHNGEIFESTFENLQDSGTGRIQFKRQPRANGGIAVLYAPNGTGKSSLATVLRAEQESDDIVYSAVYEQRTITPASKIFQVIGDQICRNIIPGNTSDYLIGRDIRREYRLRDLISTGFQKAFASDYPKILKEEFKINKKSDALITYIRGKDRYCFECISDIVNKQSRGKNIDSDAFIDYVSNAEHRVDMPEDIDEEKRSFLIEDFSGDRLIDYLLQLDLNSITSDMEISQIEQNDDAIRITEKYIGLAHCVVCDNEDYHADILLRRKKENRKRIYDSLDANTKSLLDRIVTAKKLNISDPFAIKESVMCFITTGEDQLLRVLIEDLKKYTDYVIAAMINKLLGIFDESDMFSNYAEYRSLQERIPQIDSEELLFIQEVISANINEEITIVRDQENDNNFKLMLDGKPFLNKERAELQLSTGEQNFISLAFELLLARNSNKEIIVLDDPISSFDSVYKNKIAYCIVKFLENKNQIILTHNTDLIRLLEVQLNNCFNLYLFNNSENGNNGFIPVAAKEKRILINMYELIKLFRNEDGSLSEIVEDRRCFLMSMIPFMRGYAHISPNGNDLYSRLSELMHGYTQASEDIALIYASLFGFSFDSEIVTTQDVLNVDCSGVNIINHEEYPLLSETLKQTLTYYHLRMKVESALVETFHMEINLQHPPMLSQLIRNAFRDRPDATQEEKERNRSYRVFFTSRKTLINEFNHFEGNMNIFQPAIDITADALQREISEIEQRINCMREEFAD